MTFFSESLWNLNIENGDGKVLHDKEENATRNKGENSSRSTVSGQKMTYIFATDSRSG